MTAIADVRDGIARAIRTGTNLRAQAYLLDKIPAPCAQVMHGEYDPRLVFDDRKSEHHFTIRLYFPRIAEEANTKRLDKLREASGAGSIREAVSEETNWPAPLRDAVEAVSVTSIGEVSSLSVADEVFLSCDIELEVVF